MEIHVPKLKITSENATHLFVCELWAYLLLDFFRVIVMHLPVVGSFSVFVIPFLLGIPFVIGLPYILKHIKPIDVILYLLVVLFYMASFAIHPENQEALEKYLKPFLLFSLPYFFVGLFTENDKLFDRLSVLSALCVCASALYYLVYVQGASYTGSSDASAYKMSASYAILPHVLMVCNVMLKKANVFNILVFILGFVLISSFGTRGPFVCLLLFIAFYLLFVKKYQRPVVSKLIVCVVGFGFIGLADPIVLFMQQLTQELGMSSRIFDIMEEDFVLLDFSNSSGRDSILATLFCELQKDVPFGYGIAGDRRFVGIYAHNIAVELWFSFGYVIGTILLLAVVFAFLRGYSRSVSETGKVFIIVLIVSGFVKLFFSGSYLFEKYLFWALGVCVAISRRKKHQLIINS